MLGLFTPPPPQAVGVDPTCREEAEVEEGEGGSDASGGTMRCLHRAPGCSVEVPDWLLGGGTFTPGSTYN